MGDKWKSLTLGDCILLKSGGTPSKSQSAYWGDGLPWISAKDMKSFWIEDSEDHLTDLGKVEAACVIEPGTTLMLIRGMTLHNDVPICRVRQESAFNQDVKAILPRAGTQSDFVPYLLLGIKDRLLRSVDSAGHGTGRLNTDTLLGMTVNLPEVTEQRAIASILGALDNKIELNRQRNRTLEAMARALFQSWFVDFDPVKAKADGKQPPGLKPEIAALFPDSFEPIPTLVPTGWKTFSINSLCEIGRGSSPRPIHNFMGGDVPWIKIADATAAEGPFIYSTKEYVTKEGSEKSFWVSPGDLILSNSATCGVPIYVGIRGCIHDGWLHFRNLKSISKGFLYHWLHSISEHLVHIADGSVQKNLNTKLVGEQRIVVAPDAILNHFEELNSVVFAQIDCHIRELNALKSLRDTLLPRLISGELRVRDAERIIARNI